MQWEHNGAEREEEGQKPGAEERGPGLGGGGGARPLTTTWSYQAPWSTLPVFTYSVLTRVPMSGAVLLSPILQMSN